MAAQVAMTAVSIDFNAGGLCAISDVRRRCQKLLASRYDLEREVGRGGMATVYRARDSRHGRVVAIKVMDPELATADATERFLREVRVAARLNHPHLLPLIDSGEGEGIFYFIMPYVGGGTLRERLDGEKRLPLGDALRITREVGSALTHMHEEGVVHRDIKPENILLSSGHAVVTDFGIAYATGHERQGRLTLAGRGVGTPGYISPEQARGGEVDGRSDVYSLACVLFEMLAGEPPFRGNSQAVIDKHLTAAPPALRTVRGGTPANVEAAVLRAMAKLPNERFATANQFAAGLSEPLSLHRAELISERVRRALGSALHMQIG
jgi:serine/threonine-protein kinase